MLRSTRRFAAVLLVAAAVPLAHAGRSTVCTITVNSPDEKQVFRKYLPDDQYDFVELVERGRPDWLDASCSRNIQCDILVISGHFDSGTEFYSDKLDARESLPVEEMERVSCGGACGLFSKLKEVYLFGCNTLNGDAGESVAAEVVRTLTRTGVAPADATALAQSTRDRYVESNRDAMRRIFANVPVIYGFSSLAPLGAVAGPMLEKALQTAPAGEIGNGRPSPTLLRQFAASSMISTSGLGAGEPRMGTREDVCQYAAPPASAAERAAAIHRALEQDMPRVRMQFDRLEKLAASIPPSARDERETTDALVAIANDEDTRERYLRFARNTDRPEIRQRLLRLSRSLGWLNAETERLELADMIGDQLQRPDLSYAEAELVCTLNADHALDTERGRLAVRPALAERPAQSAVLACLGDEAARKRVLAALASPAEDNVHVAQVFLSHRPIADPAEVRTLALAVAGMDAGPAQVRALDALAFQHVDDRESLERLAGLFTMTRSLAVQRAIAGILLRADHRMLPKPELVRSLQRHRMKSPEGADLIDVLIRRLQIAASIPTPPA